MLYRRTLSLAKSRIQEEQETKRRQFALQERELTLREFEAGLISRNEYRRTLKRKACAVSPPEDALSSDWDLGQLDDDMANAGPSSPGDWEA